jgi:enoyl-CoA hydratase/carnithine racemase
MSAITFLNSDFGNRPGLPSYKLVFRLEKNMMCDTFALRQKGNSMSKQQLKFCTTDLNGHILTVTINRPEVMNSLHSPANIELGEVFDSFSEDPEQWIAIITGAGDRAFSAGNDLKYQASGGKLERAPKGFAGLTSRFDCIKPIIAAVNGVAMGGGFEIALACDIIIASDNAVFALPEPRVGLAALAGGLHRLPRQVGLKQAMGMILTGRRVGAEEGRSLGFVNEVVPQADLLAAANRWAELILECSPLSIRASKASVMRGLDESNLEQAIAQKLDAVRTLFTSEDFIEGPKAFAEKRPPNWKGH